MTNNVILGTVIAH